MEENWREQHEQQGESRDTHCYKQAVEHDLPGGPWSLAFFTVKRKKEKNKVRDLQ